NDSRWLGRNASVAGVAAVVTMGHACGVVKEVLDDGAPDRDPWRLRWARADPVEELEPHAVRPRSPGGRRRWVGVAVAAVVLLAGGGVLRGGGRQPGAPPAQV